MIELKDFIDALDIAVNSKTLYIKGGFGLTLDAKGKQRAINSYAYNKKRADKINAMPDRSSGFDCIGLIKGCAGGYKADFNKVYGGAVYNADHTLGKDHDIPDKNESGTLDICISVSSNMKDIKRGEFLYMKGHCGIYAGDGKVYESSPAYKDGAQITDFSWRPWEKHGFLPYINYGIIKKNPTVARPTLRKGRLGLEVSRLQEDLNFVLNKNIAVDGIFGSETDRTLREYQKQFNLAFDGIYGEKSYKMMRMLIEGR